VEYFACASQEPDMTFIAGSSMPAGGGSTTGNAAALKCMAALINGVASADAAAAAGNAAREAHATRLLARCYGGATAAHVFASEPALLPFLIELLAAVGIASSCTPRRRIAFESAFLESNGIL